ncbi:Outer membrane protein beta-barrel domain-containing protein [Fibrobacter sp. UWOV1]|uniref:porin family protein n=1 Tax=Fibrobacter sp. UWOV1 TaxID=1896215 RepID=UPI00091205F2|nr:porin family protein [Fibrobacter sp. UWOV1]SHL01320.1 Outer membrane protein beta-barrel domain-containing protein [Fibrobacter sp. UWOV1]
MKKLWTLIASTMLVASVAFAQDDFDPEYTDQAEEQVAEQAEEQAEEQPAEQEQVAEPVEEKANVAEEPAPAPAPAPQYQASAQEPAQENVQNDEYAPANANNTPFFGFGLKFAFNYGRMFGFKEDLDNDSDIDGTPSGIGFDGGLMFRIQMIPNLYFTPEVNIAHITTEHEFMHHKRKYVSTDLELPLLMRGVIANRFYVTGGAQFNFTLSSKAKIDAVENATLDITVASNEKVEQATFGFGIVAGAGVNIVAGLFFDFRFYMGITELYPDVKTLDDLEFATGDYSLIDMSGARMMKIKVGLSYWII